jgi:glucan 1,3-beta-glucosidase
MDDLFHKGKAKFKHAFDKFSGPQTHHTPSVPMSVQKFGTETDIWRMRKQRGVNLGEISSHGDRLYILTLFVGSWFTLERWIAPGPFANAAGPGQADLHVAQGSNAREILEQHWDTWITDSDWQWLAQRGFNTVRIPVRQAAFINHGS